MATKTGGKRSKVFQTDLPRSTLEEALRVPQAIADNFALDPTPPIRVALAMQLSPGSPRFRMLCGAAVGYGLIKGGAHANEIAVERLGKRILRPTEEGDDYTARQIAILQPRIINEFLSKYDGHSIPKNDVAHNVLVTMGLPEGRAAEGLELIMSVAESVDFVTHSKGKAWVDLSGIGHPAIEELDTDITEDTADEEIEFETPPPPPILDDIKLEAKRKRRVYITHGKNKTFVEPIKKLLEFGELEAVVSTQKVTVAKPVPDKVIDDMRSCGAAIIHIDAEQKLQDEEGNEQIVLNPNVLIEIGAAMALYGRRYIFLVKEGITLPSNIQGLFEVRYSGDALGTEGTLHLLEAVNDLKNYPLPASGVPTADPPTKKD
jgi:hypothetical protein